MADTITVCGVTFSSEEVISAVIKKDGREIIIQPKPDPTRSAGFRKEE